MIQPCVPQNVILDIQNAIYTLETYFLRLLLEISENEKHLPCVTKQVKNINSVNFDGIHELIHVHCHSCESMNPLVRNVRLNWRLHVRRKRSVQSSPGSGLWGQCPIKRKHVHFCENNFSCRYNFLSCGDREKIWETSCSSCQSASHDINLMTSKELSEIWLQIKVVFDLTYTISFIHRYVSHKSIDASRSYTSWCINVDNKFRVSIWIRSKIVEKNAFWAQIILDDLMRDRWQNIKPWSVRTASIIIILI